MLVFPGLDFETHHLERTATWSSLNFSNVFFLGGKIHKIYFFKKPHLCRWSRWTLWRAGLWAAPWWAAGPGTGPPRPWHRFASYSGCFWSRPAAALGTPRTASWTWSESGVHKWPLLQLCFHDDKNANLQPPSRCLYGINLKTLGDIFLKWLCLQNLQENRPLTLVLRSESPSFKVIQDLR